MPLHHIKAILKSLGMIDGKKTLHRKKVVHVVTEAKRMPSGFKQRIELREFIRIVYQDKEGRSNR